MAEILIHRGDPTANQEIGAYHDGDIVEISEDGEYTNKPWLTVIRLPGLSVDQVQALVEEVKDDSPDKMITIRRRFKIPKVILDKHFSFDGLVQKEFQNEDFEKEILDELHDKVTKKTVKGTVWRQTLHV